MENEPLPTTWTCPSCGAKKQREPDRPSICARCGWKPGQTPPSGLIWYLLVGLTPAPAFLVLMGFENLPAWTGAALITMAIGCSLTAGYGMVSRVDNPIVKAMGGITLSAAFFVFNLALAIAAGCSGMGRISP